MVLRTTAAGLLAMMMTRANAVRDPVDTAWLLHGPTDPETVAAAEEEPPLLLAAE